ALVDEPARRDRRRSEMTGRERVDEVHRRLLLHLPVHDRDAGGLGGRAAEQREIRKRRQRRRRRRQHVLAPHVEGQLELLPEPHRRAIHGGGELELAGRGDAGPEREREPEERGEAPGPRASPAPPRRGRAIERRRGCGTDARPGYQSFPPALCCCGGLGWFFRFCFSLLWSACSIRSACSLLIAPFWAAACCDGCGCGCCCCGCGLGCDCGGGCFRLESGCCFAWSLSFQQYSRFCFASRSSGRSSSAWV